MKQLLSRAARGWPRLAGPAVLCVVLVPQTLNGSEPLKLQVSPAISRAPAILTVRAVVEPSPDNRVLEIAAESNEFFRSSQVQVDGERGVALNVVQFKNLPTGLYRVTCVLVGVHGPRATAMRLARVEGFAGSGQ